MNLLFDVIHKLIFTLFMIYFLSLIFPVRIYAYLIYFIADSIQQPYSLKYIPLHHTECSLDKSNFCC